MIHEKTNLTVSNFESISLAESERNPI